MTSLEIAGITASHYLTYTHFQVIGACTWLECTPLGCGINLTPELDEYLPDLVVTVFNENGDNPWDEAKLALDKPSYLLANITTHAATGVDTDIGNGVADPETPAAMSNGDIKVKTVDVIGNPNTLFQFPFVSLRPDTFAFLPYYQSDLDLPGRLGIAESIRIESYSAFNYYIGSSFADHWGYEFPRSMDANTSNDFKASVIVALHAADIVTNTNIAHVVKGTTNSCGQNCAVANVIEEESDDHEIWEEVYPNDKRIRPGESDSLSKDSIGSDDENAGNGNYVFVVWRHYQGCVQSAGELISDVVNVPDTEKR